MHELKCRSTSAFWSCTDYSRIQRERVRSC